MAKRNYIDKREVERMFKDYLDDIYGEIQILSSHYLASEILESLDPAGYRKGLLSFVNSLLEEGYEVEDF